MPIATTVRADPAAISTAGGIDLQRLRQRQADPAWAATWGRIEADAQQLAKRGVRIPPPEPQSGWGHDYICPTCATRLTFDINLPHTHRCKPCGQEHTSKRIEEAWVYQANLWQIDRAVSAALVAAVKGDDAMAKLARDTVVGYAQMYAQYPEHGDRAGKGRVQGQSLCEAAWMCRVMQIYDLLRDIGQLSPEDQQLVTEQMLRPAIELLRRQTHMIHNIHVWHSAAIFAMAASIGDEESLVFAESFIARNLDEGVLADGLWYEISLGYHFYTLSALEYYLMAAHRHGRAFVRPDKLRRMYDAPIALVCPDGSIPLFNDTSERMLAGEATTYELAQHWFGGYEPVLGAIYGQYGAKRKSTAALLYGSDLVDAGSLQLPRFAVVDGLVVSRRGGLTAYLKASPNGSGHDHFDRLSLDLHPHDSTLKAADLGNPNYGHPLHYAWFKSTAAHNTIIVDSKNQKRHSARISFTHDGDAFAAITAISDGGYDGVTMRRTCIFGDGWVFDYARAEAQGDTEHDYAWIVHANGELSGMGELVEQPWVEHPNLTQQRRQPMPTQPVALHWSERDGKPGRLHAMLIPMESTAYLGTGQGPDLPLTQHVDILAVGRRGRSIRVATLFSLNGNVTCNATPDGDGLRVDVGTLRLRIEGDGRVLQLD